MKNIPGILLLIIVLSLFDWSSGNADTPIVDINEREAIGLVAFIVNSNESDNSDNTISCECNGTEVLTHGDGNETPCPCTHNGVCNCKKSGQSSVSVESEDLILDKEIFDQYYIVYWTASWCSVCEKWSKMEKQKLIDAGIKITEIDIDKQKSVSRLYKMDNVSMPSFWIVRKRDRTLTDDDKYIGYMTFDEIKSAILKYHNR